MRSYIAASLFALASAGSGHTRKDMPKYGAINHQLGVHGWAHCVPGPQGVTDNLVDNQMNMVCSQQGAPGTLKIACVGDSITAGAHASNASMAYPQQLQAMLDPTKYAVTNLGACGSTMQRKGDSPYWQRPQFTALNSSKWDIVVIMLGTNDAKDKGDGGPSNWSGCDGVEGCAFAQDYLAMIELVRTLGTTPGVPPAIYVAAPPPLMQHGSIGANQTAINTVYPALIPLIAEAANLTTVPISIFSAMGGVPSWQTSFPPNGCTLSSSWTACPWYCDSQSCDQCHPNNVGYSRLARSMRAGLNL